VSEIAVSPAQVRVVIADGTAEEGWHVAVTVPLGVLKRGLLLFSPVLPPDRLAAIGRLGFGRFGKVALRFTEHSLPAVRRIQKRVLLFLRAHFGGGRCPTSAGTWGGNYHWRGGEGCPVSGAVLVIRGLGWWGVVSAGLPGAQVGVAGGDGGRFWPAD
jgi:Flavin containing amine oxidoreductase